MYGSHAQSLDDNYIQNILHFSASSSPFPVPMAWSRGQNLPVSNSGTRFLLPKPRASPIYQMMLTRLELNSFPESPEELD